MRKILPFILCILLFSLVAAAEADLYYPKDRIIDIKVPCVVNDAACKSTALCNISVNYPNGSKLVTNEKMTFNKQYFNYTLKNTNTLGVYQAVVFCNATTAADFSEFSFQITENGEYTNDWTFIIGVLAIVLLCFYFAFSVQNGQFVFLQYILFVFGFLFAIYIPAFFIITNSRSLFYKSFMAFVAVLAIYAIVYLSYLVLIKIGLLVPGKGGDDDGN